jgi:hypothetical protein
MVSLDLVLRNDADGSHCSSVCFQAIVSHVAETLRKYTKELDTTMKRFPASLSSALQSLNSNAIILISSRNSGGFSELSLIPKC